MEPKLIIRHDDDLEKSIKCYGCDKSFKSYTRLSKHKCRKKNEESKKSAEEQSSSETVRPKKEDLHLGKTHITFMLSCLMQACPGMI